MTFSDNIRQSARDDSRRFAKGVYCRILYEPKTIYILYKYNIVPRGLRLSTPLSNPYFDSTYGKFFALPFTYSKRYDYELKLLSNTGPINPTMKETDELEDIFQKEMKFADFLMETIVLITVPKIRLATGDIVDPTRYDVIIETSDISQTMDCIFVESSATVERPSSDPSRKF